MKKYIIIVLISVFGLIGFSNATSCTEATVATDCLPGWSCTNIEPFSQQGTCSGGGGGTGSLCQLDSDCSQGFICNFQTPLTQGTCWFAPGGNNTGGTTAGNMGIDINEACLINGQCKFDIYETLGIRKSLPKATRSSPGIFIQDIILSATFFVGTLITGVLIISGLLYVFAGANAGLAAKAKKGITGSFIGLLFVVCSYAFVRLIQFLVTGGGG